MGDCLIEVPTIQGDGVVVLKVVAEFEGLRHFGFGWNSDTKGRIQTSLDIVGLSLEFGNTRT